MKRLPRNSLALISSRYYFVYAVLILLTILLCWRIISLHLSKVDKDETLKQKGVYQSTKIIRSKGYRGNIIDRNGDIMAMSLPVKNVIIDPERFINFLAADFLNAEKNQFIQRLSHFINQHQGISKVHFLKIVNMLSLKEKVLIKHIKANAAIKEINWLKNNTNLSKTITAMMRAYLNERIDKIFKHGINRDIYSAIARAVAMSTSTFKKRLKTSPSRKYLKIAVDLDMASHIYQRIERLINKKQRVFYKDKSYREQYFAAAILLEAHTKRYYPQDEVSAPLLGLVDQNDKGIEGLERIFNNLLSGQDGKKRMIFSNSHEPYADVETISTVKQGSNLQLTIDNNIQYYVYAAIEKFVKQRQAEYGSVIVVNPKGEVLAMVNYPSANPNERNYYNPDLYRNRIILDAIEVGSTMKPFAALFALENKHIFATETLDLSQAIAHHKPDKYATLTISQVLQKSHNLGILNISERLSNIEMWEMLSRLRFGKNSGVLPMIENVGLLRHHKKWHYSDKRALSFGYGPMNTTLAQLARAYLIFLNQGRITDLKLLKKDSTKPVYEQVFNKAVVVALVKMLDAAVSDKGSGYRAQIKGYAVAGKTGTTRLRKENDKGYDKDRHGTFFVGFAPAYQAQYLMIVHIHNPKGKYVAGANVAAPVFKLAMENILKFQ